MPNSQMETENLHHSRTNLSQINRKNRLLLCKDAFRQRLEVWSTKALNPPIGLRASHESMREVSTIPKAEQQNPGSEKTPSSSASQDSTQPAELEQVMSLETPLVQILRGFGAI